MGAPAAATNAERSDAAYLKEKNARYKTHVGLLVFPTHSWQHSKARVANCNSVKKKSGNVTMKQRFAGQIIFIIKNLQMASTRLEMKIGVRKNN